MASTVFQLSLRVIGFTLTIAIATFPTCTDQQPCNAATTLQLGKEKLIAKTTVAPSPNHESKDAADLKYDLQVTNLTAVNRLNDEMETVTSESTRTATRSSDKDMVGTDLGTLLDAGEDAVVTPQDGTDVYRLLAETSTPAAADSQPTTEAQSLPRTGHAQTPATVAPPTPPRQTAAPDGDAVFLLRNLSAEEKGHRLIQAAWRGRVEEVEALLLAGADIGAREEGRRTALHYAAILGHVEVVRRLLGAGAEVDARTSVQLTPLLYAAFSDHAAVVRLLLASSADPNSRDADGWSALHMAAASGYSEVAAALLAAGADRGARTKLGTTPLDLARLFNNQQLVDMLK